MPLFTASGVTLHGFFAFLGRTRDFQVLPDTAGSCGDPEPGLTVQGSEPWLQPAGPSPAWPAEPRTPSWCWSLLICSLQRPSRGLGSLPQAFAGATHCFQRSVLLLTLSGNAVSGALPGMRLAQEGVCPSLQPVRTGSNPGGLAQSDFFFFKLFENY